jgi:hypothetical protein
MLVAVLNGFTVFGGQGGFVMDNLESLRFNSPGFPLLALRA